MTSPWRKRVETVGVGSLTLALGILAFVHEGVPAAEVELNDGGVWITNANQMLVGHLNYQAQTLDGGFQAAAVGFDVSQFGTSILVISPDLVQPVDTANVAITGEASVTGIDVAHGGDLVLFVAADEGKVWATDVAGAPGFTPAAEPLLDELDSPRVAVGVDGTGFVLTADGEVLKLVEPGPDEQPTESLGQLDEDLVPDAQLTVVGRTPVVLNGSQILTTEHQIEIDELGDAVLQQPSAAGGEVILASEDALWRVPLTQDSEATRQEVPRGLPAEPVMVGGCAYGLWAQSGYYVRDCGDADLDQAAQFPELAAAVQPVFRINRDVIVINDIVSGAAYLPLESMLRVDNWDLIAKQLEEEEDNQESEESDETELSQLQEFSEEQNPPVANDDQLGARAGAATTLPILINDVDIDGDVLTAVLEDVPSDVSVALAKDGRAARVEVPADKVGSFSFTYRAFDGIDLSNVATVTVRVMQPEANQAPERIRPNPIKVAERATVEYSVLPDWVDPDGDPIFLANAVAEDGLAVTWRPDGYISVRDLGSAGPGRRTVSLTVSDGSLSTTEELVVQVTPGSSDEPPVANNDHYVAAVGEEITIRPLSNDTDPEGKQLRLVEVGPVAPEVEVTTDYQDDSLQFVASVAGTQTIVYSISDGPNNAKGKIRVDVIDPEEADEQPAAENDLALLPPNGSVVVEPLVNDFDPAGGVLVIQGVSMGSADQLTVEVVRHSLLLITAPAGLDEPQSFEYTVSNGRASATATVLVVPMAAATQLQPPVALPESTVVRAGDIVSVDVLANDYSPSGLDITLAPELDITSDESLGEFFVSGEQVRFKAADVPGTAKAFYTISDSEGNIDTSTVEITIRDFDERNQQPVPRPVEARTFAGTSVRVTIPMDGVDPDGDSVELVGLGSQAPRHGAVTVEGNYLVYEAAREAGGTDTFTYVVADRFGAQAEGVVRVGIAPAPASNQPPVAVPDEIAARPGTRLEIPVTANDVDPDGDEISIVANSVEPVDDRWDPQAEIEGQKVIVITPDEEGIYQFYYAITDGGGVPVVGVTTVYVDENVPPVAPIARDDYVAATSIAGLESVEVEVLANDGDPDGVVDDLVVTVDEPATVSGSTVTVPLTADRQIVLYTITDPDELSARAAIVVPGRDQIPPHLDPDLMPAVVKGGETLTIDLDEYVITRPDHRATLTAVDTVVAGPGGDPELPDSGLGVESETIITFTPDVHFIGTSSVSFEVTDGDSLDDPRGLRARLSLPITVESSGLFPPEVRPSEITVAPGEDPIEVSLAAMVDDPDPGDNEAMTYTATSVSAPVQATINGQSVSVSVPADTAVGTTGQIVVSVHDGSTDPVEMAVPVRVIRSTRPLMNVADFSVDEGRVGTAIPVDLSQLVDNPFADVGGEVTLVGSPQVSGPATVTAEGLVLTITPTDSGSSSDGSEDVVVSYTVADATLDSTRHRSGVIRVTVKDIPKAPYNVSASHEASRTAQVSWSHVGWRGGKPRGYTVRWAGGSQFCGMQTMCNIVNLPNNNNYVFTVTAEVEESDISDSPASDPSNEIFVDVLPNTPAAPVARFGDRQIDLSWTPTTVPDGGSPVTSYTVEIMPADATGRTQQTTSATSLTWPNLVNGTSYTFTVTAHNRLTEVDNQVEAPTGPASAPEVPAGAPSNQAAPSVAKDRAAAGVSPRATVSWGAPGNDNGDRSFTYELRQSGTTNVLYSGSGNSNVVTMSIGTEDKTFEVRSTNKSGLWSEWSPVSNAVRAFQPPGAPQSFTLTPTGEANQVRFNFSAAAGNGARTNEISYRWNAGGQSGTVTPGQTVRNAGVFPNGSNVTVTLTAISTVNGETAEGGAATATVNAYAPPAAPTVSARGNANNVTQEWNMGSSSNGRTVTAVQLDPGGETSTLRGSRTQGNGRNQTHCIRARARNSEGQWGPWSDRSCASTWADPYASFQRGALAPCPDTFSPGQTCHYFEYQLRRYNPNSRVACDFSGTQGSYTQTVTVDSNGNWGYGRVTQPNNYVWRIATGHSQPENITYACRQQ